jgi:hypothetical protein
MSLLTYEPELGAKIADELSKGRYLSQIAKEVGVPANTILNWAVRDVQGFGVIYARAREAQMEAWSHELASLADQAKDRVNVNSIRLQIDTKKWLMSRIYAKRYGDKVSLAGADGVSDITIKLMPVQASPKPVAELSNDLPKLPS